MVIDSNFIIAVTSIVALVIAVLTFVVQNTRTKFTVGIEMLMKLDEQYNGTRMKLARHTAANEHLHGNTDLSEILDFFEFIGLMVEKDVVEAEFIYCIFFNDIISYCALARDQIIEARTEDATVWENVAQLDARMQEIEKAKRNCRDEDVIPDTDDLRAFLTAESNLGP